MRRSIVACLSLGLWLFLSPHFSSAQETNILKLPAPQTDGGKPLMQALKARQSTRGNFGPAEKLSMQTLSNLLWAADGVNRPNNFRTAPSAAGWHNIEIYVATADGLFLYDPLQHALKVISKEDVRAISGLEGPAATPGSKMGTQDFAKTAPLSLVYVADMSKTRGMKYQGEDVGVAWSYANAGAIFENVYLFCASEGLACIIRAMLDQAKVASVFKLRPEEKPILTQTIAQFKK